MAALSPEYGSPSGSSGSPVEKGKTKKKSWVEWSQRLSQRGVGPGVEDKKSPPSWWRSGGSQGAKWVPEKNSPELGWGLGSQKGDEGLYYKRVE